MPSMPQVDRLCRLGLAVMVGVGVLWGGSVANAAMVWTGSYDPSLGTLPSDQGWTAGGSGGPPPAVVDGVLHQGPTGDQDLRYWERYDLAADYSTSAGLVVEFKLRIVTSTYGPGGCGDDWRAGYMLLLNDVAGRVVIVGISDTGVRLATDGCVHNSSSSPFVEFDTVSQFNTYLLTVDPSGIVLSINGGEPVATLPLGVASGTPNYRWFGDGTGGAGNESHLQSLRWGSFSSATPGEATSLRVTSHDPLTGDLSLSYVAACAASAHDIHYGPLSDVATYGWSGSTCNIGDTGHYAGFNPGEGSYFFVVVGNADAVEGSYGADSLGAERPAVGASYCGREQELATACP